jgi:hypothetical protein
MMVAKNMLIFPAIYIGQAELLYSLKVMDLSRILLILDEHFVEKYEPAGNYLCDDFQSPEQTITHILEWKEKKQVNFIGIIGTDEEMQFQFTRRIAEHFQIEFYDRVTCAIASNKYLMKKAFVENDVPSGRFALLSDLDPQSVDHVGFPNVLKMINGTASEYMFFNRDMSALQRNYALLKKAVSDLEDTRLHRTVVSKNGTDQHFNPRQQFVLDEFIKGEEYSADFLVYARKLSIIRVVKKIKHPLFGYFTGYHLLSRSAAVAQGLDLERLRQVCRKLASSLRIEQGVCMADFMLDGGNLNVLETSIRPGFSTFMPLMQKICGYTSLSIMADLNLGHIPRVGFPGKEGLVVQLFAPKEGTLKVFDTTRIEERPETLEVFKYSKPGDFITHDQFSQYGLLLGFVLLDQGKADVITLAGEIEHDAEIVIENEYSPCT